MVKNANTQALIGHAMDRDLAEALGRPVRIENDANCFALSEAVDGAVRAGLPAIGVWRDRVQETGAVRAAKVVVAVPAD